MAGFENQVLIAKNVNFNPNLPPPHLGTVNSDGQLIIGTTALNAGGTHLNIGQIVSLSPAIVVGYSSPNITLTFSAANALHFTADDANIATPASNNINIFTAVQLAGTNPIRSTAAGSTLTINVQRAQAIAATDATKVGLSVYDSGDFSVDANGFVTLAGGGAGQTITGQSGGALSPVAGNWNIYGASTAAGTSPVVTSGAGNTLTVNVQKTQAIAATDATKIGLAAFDSTDFAVDANGFVALAGGGAGQTITGDTGGPLVPSGGNWNIFGAHGINTSGAASTLTVAINNAIVLGDLAVLGAGVAALEARTGDVKVTAGNYQMPTTISANVGNITYAGGRFIHAFGTDNCFFGQTAGNHTLTTAQGCVGVGVASLASLTTGFRNVGIGNGALNALQGAVDNTAVGQSALNLNVSGNDNTAVGSFALSKCTQGGNTAVGQQALANITSGNESVAVGYSSLNLATGSSNTAVGHTTMDAVTTGQQNTCIGAICASNFTTGSNNIIIGYNTGNNYTTSESSNIIIGNSGTLAESNVIRIGTQGSGAGQQNKAFMAGVYGVSVASTQQVVIDSNGQLGTSSGDTSLWVEVTGTSQTAAVGTGYITNNAGLVTVTLPANFAVGESIRIAGLGAGGWLLQANTGDIINFGSSPTTAGGSLASTNRYDTVEILGVVTNTTWNVLSSVGNLTVA